MKSFQFSLSLPPSISKCNVHWLYFSFILHAKWLYALECLPLFDIHCFVSSAFSTSVRMFSSSFPIKFVFRICGTPICDEGKSSLPLLLVSCPVPLWVGLDCLSHVCPITDDKGL